VNLPPKAAIIANPVSGGGRGRKMAEKARRYIQEQGLEVEIHWTSKSGDGTSIARQLLSDGVLRIAGCGGDGTLNEVANALAYTEGVLGVLPGGRGNDLARGIDVPRNIIQASDIFVHGRLHHIDLGKIGDRYFNTIATLGFDAEVSRLAIENDDLPFSGPSTYVYAVFKTMTTFESPKVRLEGDFGVYEGPIFLTATSNSSRYGGGMCIAPPAKMDDGIFHVCLIEAIPMRKVLTLFPLVFTGRHISQPSVKLFTTKQMKIDSETESRIYADGECMGSTPATIEMAAGALKVMVPLPLEN
jgi:YegS/Rv2252/BmrU family lipid kinase